MKFTNTSANTPLIEDRRIYAAGETAAAVAAAKIRRINFQVLSCHECVAGPEWDSHAREESDYLHHVNLVTRGSATIIYHGEKLHLRPGHAYLFPGNTPLARSCRRGFTSFLLVFRCEWFPGIDFLLDWPERKPIRLGTFDEIAWRNRLAFGPGAAVNTMLEVQSQIGLWVAAACPNLDAVITKHIDCHSRFSKVFAYVDRAPRRQPAGLAACADRRQQHPCLLYRLHADGRPVAEGVHRSPVEREGDQSARYDRSESTADRSRLWLSQSVSSESTFQKTQRHVTLRLSGSVLRDQPAVVGERLTKC
jgi:hypothetical protein